MSKSDNGNENESEIKIPSKDRQSLRRFNAPEYKCIDAVCSGCTGIHGAQKWAGVGKRCIPYALAMHRVARTTRTYKCAAIAWVPPSELKLVACSRTHTTHCSASNVLQYDADADADVERDSSFTSAALSV